MGVRAIWLEVARVPKAYATIAISLATSRKTVQRVLHVTNAGQPIISQETVIKKSTTLTEGTEATEAAEEAGEGIVQSQGFVISAMKLGILQETVLQGKKEKLITAEEETEAATTVEKLDTFPGTVIKREKKGMEGILGSATNAKKSDIWQKTVHLKVRLI